jgi:hypothetical protein
MKARQSGSMENSKIDRGLQYALQILMAWKYNTFLKTECGPWGKITLDTPDLNSVGGLAHSSKLSAFTMQTIKRLLFPPLW